MRWKLARQLNGNYSFWFCYQLTAYLTTVKHRMVLTQATVRLLFRRFVFAGVWVVMRSCSSVWRYSMHEYIISLCDHLMGDAAHHTQTHLLHCLATTFLMTQQMSDIRWQLVSIFWGELYLLSIKNLPFVGVVSLIASNKCSFSLGI